MYGCLRRTKGSSLGKTIKERVMNKELREWYNKLPDEERDKITDIILNNNLSNTQGIRLMEELRDKGSFKYSDSNIFG